MQFEVFTVPAGGGEAMVELNRFLSIHRVIGVENHLVTAQGGGPVWVFCVEYLRGAGMEGRTAGGGAAEGDHESGFGKSGGSGGCPVGEV